MFDAGVYKSNNNYCYCYGILQLLILNLFPVVAKKKGKLPA